MYLLTVFILYHWRLAMLHLSQRYDDEINENLDYLLNTVSDIEYQDTLSLLSEHNFNIARANLPSYDVQYIDEIIIH
jgi:hypothetical protein